MKRIPLTQGKFAAVDNADYKELNRYKWYAMKGGNTFYAERYKSIEAGREMRIKMHRFILDAPKTTEVDHINHDGLDNRRSNLRLCSRQQNQGNRKLNYNNTSGFKCVYWRKDKKLWQAQIGVLGKTKHLGYFFCIVKAAIAYDTAAKALFSDFAHTNF